MKRTTESQVNIVKRELKAGKKLTPRDMYNRFFIMRLAARILDCRNEGMNIKAELIHEYPVKYSQYSLIKTKQK